MSQVASTLPPILCIPLFIGVADAVEATFASTLNLRQIIY